MIYPVMGLPLSLPGVQDSWAVLSVISSTATLSGGPGGPKSIGQWVQKQWNWGDHLLEEPPPPHQIQVLNTLLHIKAIILPLIKGLCVQGLVCMMCGAEEPLPNTRSTSIDSWVGSFMSKGKEGCRGWGGGTSVRRINKESRQKDSSVCGWLWLYHVAVVPLFKRFAWYFADV